MIPVRKIRSAAQAILHCADMAVFAALIAGLIFLTGLFGRKLRVLFVLYPAVVLFGYCIRLICRKKTEERKKALRKKKERILKLLLIPDEEIETLTGESDVYFIRKLHPDESDVIEAIRCGSGTILTTETTSAMQEIASASGREIRFLNVRDLIAKGEKEKTYRRSLRDDVRGTVRSDRKYLLFAGAVFLLSVFSTYKIYYRLIAALSLFFAGVIGLFGGAGRGKFFLEFLDKKDGR